MGVFFKKFDIHEYAEYSMAATTLAGQSDVGICPSAREAMCIN